MEGLLSTGPTPSSFILTLNLISDKEGRGVSRFLIFSDKEGEGGGQFLTLADKWGGVVLTPPFLADVICEQPLIFTFEKT